MPPSENSITLHATHEILSWLESQASRAVAKSPSRINEGNQDGGYDVEYTTVRAFHIQYKSIYNNRKTPFELRDNTKSSGAPYHQYKLLLNQHNTLLIHNEAINHGFYALPLVEDENGLPSTLANTIFVDVYAVERGTKYLYVSQSNTGCPQVYARTFDWYGSSPDFYPITSGIYTWRGLRYMLSRDALGFGIRDQSGFTAEYIDRLIRRVLLAHVFDPHWSSRGLASDGGDPTAEPREEIVSYLKSFIRNQRNRFKEYHDLSPQRTDQANRDFQAVLQESVDSRDPSLAGIRHSKQIIAESGKPVDSGVSTSYEDITANGAAVDASEFERRLE